MPAGSKGRRHADHHVSNLLGALGVAVHDRIADALSTGEAGGSVGAAILSIGTRPAQTIDQLARVLALSHSATVRLVDRLVERGWVSRTRRPERDGRAVALTLTATGESTSRRLLAVRYRAVSAVLDPLTRRERAVLRTLMVKMLAGLPADREEARHLCRLCEHDVCRGADCPVGSAV